MARKVELKAKVLIHSRFCDTSDDVLKDFYLVEEEGTGRKYPVCVSSVSTIMPNPLNDAMQAAERVAIKGKIKKVYSINQSGKAVFEASDSDMEKSFLGTRTTCIVPAEVEPLYAQAGRED